MSRGPFLLPPDTSSRHNRRMGIFANIFGRGQKQSTKPRAHRGTGSSKFVGEDEVAAFLRGDELLLVQSSNVAAAQYHPDDDKLMIEYLDGSAWLYGPGVSVRMAEDFARARSKGTWVWDNIKVRGTVSQHQVPAVKLR